MKIEIDFAKPDELRKTKRELEMALATIESALAAIRRNGEDLRQQVLPMAPPDTAQPKVIVIESPVSSLISSMPSEFSTPQIFASADTAGIARPKVRRELNSWVAHGTLLVEKGLGRRPSKFRKA